jgi:hypothetical protein
MLALVVDACGVDIPVFTMKKRWTERKKKKS